MTVGKSSKEWKISFKKTYILIYYLFIWLATLSCGTQDLVPGPPALEESSLRDHRGSPRRKTFLTFCVISALVWGQKTQGKRKILLKSSGMCLPGQQRALSATPTARPAHLHPHPHSGYTWLRTQETLGQGAPVLAGLPWAKRSPPFTLCSWLPPPLTLHPVTAPLPPVFLLTAGPPS